MLTIENCHQSETNHIQDEADLIDKIVDFWAGFVEAVPGECQRFRTSLRNLILEHETISGIVLYCDEIEDDENLCNSKILEKACLLSSVSYKLLPKNAILNWDSSTNRIHVKLPSSQCWQTL